MSNPEIITSNTMHGVWPFLQNIEWRDPWLVLLITFHIAVTMTALMTRNHANFQILLFLVLLLLVYFSESINEVAATHWMVFSKQQYFDSKGLFISIVFSVPILMNCMIMVASWLYQSSQLMTSLKRAQLRQQAKHRLTNNRDTSNGTNSVSNSGEKKND
ncbi:PREDICTED: transmembrane protein 18 [Ceratosolen solmsi marchali]|uniref:Transmembrane protein 18 n=1 Tax=Ceratosolen solmsi marchali TaxID=326594 RepID=A0AAJ6YVK2_9HYME|nr:PREDICTED: transmembrane protein 18 [Ceratosolen solmsi marchali]